MKIYGEHRGQKVEVEYDSSVAVLLRNRMAGIAAKATAKGNAKMAARFNESAAAWDQILSNPDLLNLVEEFGKERQEYLNHVLYDDAGFTAMF